MSHFIYCYAECHYAECHNAECRYAGRRGACKLSNHWYDSLFSFHSVFSCMFVRLRVQGSKSLVNKYFLNENGVLIQMKKLKTIQAAN